MSLPLLEVQEASVEYSLAEPDRSGAGKWALRNVELIVERGDLLGIAGVSGAGKSTLARVMTALQTPKTGKVIFDGTIVVSAQKKEAIAGVALRRLRSRFQMVFQDSATVLNPRMTVFEALSEAPLTHRLWRADEAAPKASGLLTETGLTPEHLNRLPHELSGGQRRRVVLARALATNPELLILDEPTAGLDGAAAERVIALLNELAKARGLSCILISHDLDVVRALCSRIAVMSAGEIVEIGPAAKILATPKHAETAKLLRAASGQRAWVDESVDPS